MTGATTHKQLIIIFRWSRNGIAHISWASEKFSY